MATSREAITFLGKEGTKKKLDFLAKLTERSKSAWLRWVIDKEYEQHSPATPPGNGNSQDQQS